MIKTGLFIECILAQFIWQMWDGEEENVFLKMQTDFRTLVVSADKSVCVCVCLYMYLCA